MIADRGQQLLLPYDLREWIPEDDFVHFVIGAVEQLPVESFEVNERGTGSAQYHPHLMLSLLIYCYANGLFGSRRIERATHRDIAVRYICANTHPDHDTICKFRRENYEAFSEAFLHVLQLAREMGLLRVGAISVDSTKLKANASKAKNVRYDRAGELEEQLRSDIAGLLARAEAEDSADEADPQVLPEEISRREKLLEKMRRARANIEARSRARAAVERRRYERKLRERDRRPPSRKGCCPVLHDTPPRPEEQTNLTDPDSRLMRRSRSGEYQQSYSAQACVDATGSQLMLSNRVSQSASDRNELVANVNAIPSGIGTPTHVLGDSGYAHEREVKDLESAGIEVLVSVHGESDHDRRRYDFRPVGDAKRHMRRDGAKSLPWVKRMREKMAKQGARRLYRLRKQSVEPAFGIIKQAMGFRQFLLRGKDNVQTEWMLVATAYNFRRLFTLSTQGPVALAA